jgi:hypothetical protein
MEQRTKTHKQHWMKSMKERERLVYDILLYHAKALKQTITKWDREGMQTIPIQILRDKWETIRLTDQTGIYAEIVALHNPAYKAFVRTNRLQTA